jgi:hypothetical protein
MGNKVGGNLQQKMTMGGGRFMDSQIPEEIIPEEVENEDNDWSDDEEERRLAHLKGKKTLKSIKETENDDENMSSNSQPFAASAGAITAADFGWSQNEEVFLAFQENMALIAANSFEIFKLYQLIVSDYKKVVTRV